MMMAAVTIFLGDSVFTDAIAPFLVITKRNLTKQNKIIRHQYAGKFKRVIYLGSGGLQGLAQEAALKMLELTAGKSRSQF